LKVGGNSPGLAQLLAINLIDMIYVAADHFGYKVKQIVTTWLSSNSLKFDEFGSCSESDEQSIADFIPTVAKAVLSDKSNRGIMICGTGIGVDIGANRFKGIRSVLASTAIIAQWSREYDNSNILCLSGWQADEANIKDILKVWLETPFVDNDGSKAKFLNAMDRWT
jgi:RpiB/LacA/LacB family sugar-phosphate isomerase